MKSEQIPDPDKSIQLREVENFWSTNPCNSELGNSQDRRQYFLEVEHSRYLHEAHILDTINFSEFAGRRVLEIGSGVGTDGRRFAAAGADYIGINLDFGSARLSREAMDLFGFRCPILQMDAERLGFSSATFDHVYSFGAIHHSPRPEQIIAEVYRVLKPGGTTTIMLYHKDSVNYRFEIMFLRKLGRWLLLPEFAPRVISKLTGLSKAKLQRHREIFRSEDMTHDRWVSINTDGPDCPLAKVYTAEEASSMLKSAGLVDISSSVHFFDKRHYGKAGNYIPKRVASMLGTRWGWHLLLQARKPL